MQQLRIDYEPPALPAIPGLGYVPDFVTREEELALIAAVDAEPWSLEFKRRRQHYGVAYQDTREVGGRWLLRPGAFPPWLDGVARRVAERGLIECLPDNSVVNEYLPGQGIAPHLDYSPFGPTVVSLSLGSACVMDLVSVDDPQTKHAIDLAPRSLLVLGGEARTEWMHGIAARRSDRVDGHKRARARRVSITFRCSPDAAPMNRAR